MLCCLFPAVLLAPSFAKSTTYVNLSPVEEKTFVTGNLYKVLSANPDIAQAVKISSTSFKIIGGGPGSTFVYLFGSDGYVNTIKVVVERRSALDSAAAIEGQGRTYSPLKFNYMFMSYGGSSNSQYANNRWAYNGSINQIKMAGDTPLGKTDSYIQYESYNFKYGVTQMLFNIKDDKNYVAFGDNTANFSDITLPYIHYQGLYLQSKLSDLLEVKVAGGARGNGYWGKEVRNDTRPVQSFLGADVMLKPTANFNVNVNAVMSTAEASAASPTIFGIGARYNPFSQVTLAGEYASQSELKAWQAKAIYNWSNLYLSGTYRNVPANFQTPVDTVSMRGIEGLFLSGTYRPLSFVRLSADGSRYKNSYLQDAGSNTYNKDMRGEIELTLAPNSRFLYSPWMQDHRAYTSGGLAEGAISQLSLGFKFIGSDVVYFKYEPTKYSFSSSSESNYQNDKSSVGLQMGLTETLGMNFEKEWDVKTYLANSSVENNGFFKITLNYDSKIGKTPFYTVVNSNYYTGTENNGNVTEIWADVELGYQPDEDTKIYIRGKTADYSGTGSNLTDRNEKHINVGLKTAFLSDIAWNGYGDIQGCVFIDSNGDGIKNDSEAGLAGVKVSIAGVTVITNGQGLYIIKAVRAGQASVMMDQASTGQGYILTSQNPQVLQLAAGRTMKADFGLISKSSVTGRAFKDMNKSGKFDGKDIPAAGIGIVFDGSTYPTAADGTYVIYDVKEGRHSLNINIDSLPQNFVPAVPVNNTVDVKRGETYKFNVALKGPDIAQKKAIKSKKLKNIRPKVKKAKHSKKKTALGRPAR